MYDVLIYILNYNNDSLIINVHVMFFVYMNNMYDEFFCAYKFHTLI
jgi:hypothetical protein